MVQIIGCEYQLLESEILDWLSLFGEVVTKIAEELFEDEKDDQLRKMPPVGNGVYIVTVSLKKDLPNWTAMYGRKVCLD